jgi:hypothetical protein
MEIQFVVYRCISLRISDFMLRICILFVSWCFVFLSGCKLQGTGFAPSFGFRVFVFGFRILNIPIF